MGSKLKRVAPNHSKHKPIGCNASPLIKYFEKHTNLNIADGDDEESLQHLVLPSGCLTSVIRRMKRWRAVAHQEHQSPCPPFLLNSVKLVETVPPVDVLPCRWVSFPLPKGGCLGKDALFTSPWHRPQHRSLLYCELEPRPWSDLATPFRRRGLRQVHRMSLCQRPFNTVIETGGFTSWRLWRKGKCEVQTSWHCLETELNKCVKYMLNFPLAWNSLDQNTMNPEK